MKRLFETLKKKLRTPQFTAVSINPDCIREKVYLRIKNTGVLIDVSFAHSPFCLEPLIVGVKIKSGLIKNEKQFTLIFSFSGTADGRKVQTNNLKLSANISADYYGILELSDESVLLLLKLKRSKLFHLSAIERKQLTLALYIHYLRKNNRHTINFLNNMCAVYSYPRRVVLAVIKTKSHFNIFPMDFVLHLPQENIFLLGLNENNNSLSEIFENKKMILAATPHTKKGIVYSLAEQHRKEVKDVNNLPFDFFNSELFNFPVPEFALEYKEFELISNVKLGSHYLLVCKVLNEKEIKREGQGLYHIHSIHQLHLKKNNIDYTIV